VPSPLPVSKVGGKKKGKKAGTAKGKTVFSGEGRKERGFFQISLQSPSRREKGKRGGGGLKGKGGGGSNFLCSLIPRKG